MSLPGVDELHRAFATARRSVFRLETLQTYGNSGEDADYAAFLAGNGYTPFRHDPYDHLVADRTAAGVLWHRVHVLTEPITSYIEFELCEYAANVASGEDVRILPVTEGQAWPTWVPMLDYWLIDDENVFALDYDDEGTWRGAYPRHDPDAVADTIAIRDTVLPESVPWHDYIERHPTVLAHIPQRV